MTEAFGEAPDGGALWRFSVAFCARPGVSQALIALQDRAGGDVNLMLFALWLGVSGGGRLSNEELVTADRIARPLRVPSGGTFASAAAQTQAAPRRGCSAPARGHQGDRACRGDGHPKPSG